MRNLPLAIDTVAGETATNLARMFEFFSANRCLLLVDEIDAIAKLRDDRNELGELKRVVIALLQSIDYADSRSLLVAATGGVMWPKSHVVSMRRSSMKMRGRKRSSTSSPHIGPVKPSTPHLTSLYMYLSL